MLRSIENRIESLVTGVFGRAFRSHVQPVELARKLVKEMDDHRTVSLSRVYVPNEYHLYLSPRDREQFVGYEDGLLLELSDFLAEHARRESYSLVSSPRVLLHEDPDLALGEFGISTRMAQPAASPPSSPPPIVLPPPPAPVAASAAVEASPTSGRPVDAPATPDPALPVETPSPPIVPPPIVLPAPVLDGSPTAGPPPPPEDGTRTFEPEPEPEPAPPGATAVLVIAGEHRAIGPERTVLGRARTCDVTVDDPSVSRQHAELRREGDGWLVADLGSTNGTFVNGRRIQTAPLHAGDRLTLGQSELRFERP